MKKGSPQQPRSVTPQELLGALSEIEQKFAPKRLYIQGRMGVPIPHPRVAIIGTRQPTEHGREVAWNLAQALSRSNSIVVSGLARGIDTAAHTATLEAGGRTIAVLGTPLSHPYPPENARLQAQIAQKDLVISQFPEGYPPQGKNFVLRNRTMALIADASVIVESGDGGGSLHQGWEALRLGRPLFIHSGEFAKPGLEWPRKMAEYGAVRFDDSSEILDLLPSEDLGLAVAALLPS